MRRAVREADGRQEELWRVLVVELVGVGGHERREEPGCLARIAGEDGVGAERGEREVRAREPGERIERGEGPRGRERYTERGRDRPDVLPGRERSGHQVDVQSDEQPPLVVIRPLDDRDPVELS